MAHYFFHLHEGATQVRDEEGREFADLAMAVQCATAPAREMLGHDIASGILSLGSQIEIVNGQTGVSVSVPFKSVLSIIGL
jgi:hypothetical protein